MYLSEVAVAYLNELMVWNLFWVPNEIAGKRPGYLDEFLNFFGTRHCIHTCDQYTALRSLVGL